MADSDSTTLGFAQLASGETRVIRDESEVGAGAASEPSGGAIYTRLKDMPSLEALLEEHEIVFAVLERTAPSSSGGIQGSAALFEESSRHEVEAAASAARRRRMFAAIAAPAATAAAGLVLLIAAMIPGGLRPNFYIALSIFMIGVSVLATANLALRDSNWVR